MGRLTEAQRETLLTCLDWSSPYEVAERRRVMGKIVYSRGANKLLTKLVCMGLVCMGYGTYRITSAGRAALAQSRKDGSNG